VQFVARKRFFLVNSGVEKSCQKHSLAKLGWEYKRHKKPIRKGRGGVWVATILGAGRRRQVHKLAIAVYAPAVSAGGRIFRGMSGGWRSSSTPASTC